MQYSEYDSLLGLNVRQVALPTEKAAHCQY